MIPKVLHYIWINGRDLELGEYKVILSGILNTSYKVILHTDIKPKNSQRYNPYKIKAPKSKYEVKYTEFETVIEGVTQTYQGVSDFYRTIILNNSGGIYSDLDFIWFKDIPEEFMKHNLVTCYLTGPGSITVIPNGFMASTPRNPKLKEMMGLMEDYLKQLKEKGITDIRKNKADRFLYNGIFELMSRFLKKNSDFIIPRKYMFGNHIRRIIRAVARVNGKEKDIGDPKDTYVADSLKTKGDNVLKFPSDLVGINYDNGRHDYETMLKIPEFAEKMKAVGLE